MIIVGAGVAGASAARSLARRHDVLVLEQGAQAGAEASAQNAGMVRRLVTDEVERALACRSVELLPAWVEDGLPEGAFRQTGAVLATVAEGERAEALQAAVSALRARGIGVEASSGAALQELAPALAGAHLARAWWLPEEGLLDAHAVVQTGLAVARRLGGRVERERRVGALRVEGGRVIGVQTAEGPIYAEQVLLATGAWGAWLAATAGLRRPLVPLARHLLHSDPHPLALAQHPYCWLDDAGLYVRPEGGGWLLSPCDETPLPPPAGAGSAGSVAPEMRGLAMEKLERHLPAIAGARLSGGWTGLRTFSPDRRPWIGPDPDLAGLWWLAGLGGAGVTCAFSAGEAICAAMEGARVPGLDLASLDPGRRTETDRLPLGAARVLPWND